MTVLQTNYYNLIDKLSVKRHRLKINPPWHRPPDDYQVIVLPLEMKMNNPVPRSDKPSHSHREKSLKNVKAMFKRLSPWQLNRFQAEVSPEEQIIGMSRLVGVDGGALWALSELGTQHCLRGSIHQCSAQRRVLTRAEEERAPLLLGTLP